MLVVECRPAHGYPSDLHRFHDGHRGQYPCTAYLGLYLQDPCGPLSGFKLKRNSPPRAPGDRTESLLQFEAIDLDDYPVYLISQRIPEIPDLFIIIDGLIDPLTAFVERVYFKPPALECIQDLPVGCKSPAGRLAGPIEEDVQRAFCHDL